jgi:hypothetical protein
VGFQFTPTQIVVTEAIQGEKLGHSGLNSDELKGYVDALFCIGIGFHVGVEHGLSA